MSANAYSLNSGKWSGRRGGSEKWSREQQKTVTGGERIQGHSGSHGESGKGAKGEWESEREQQRMQF